MVIMAYPRKYVNRYTTAINIERKKKDLLELLNIELTHAVNIGADSLINHAIKTRAYVSTEALNLFKELQDMECSDIREYIKQQKELEEYLSQVQIEVENEAPPEPDTPFKFFNVNIRQVLGEQTFQTLFKAIFADPSRERDYITQMLVAAGKRNGGKTDANSHDINQVYNWLIEIQRGNE